MDGKTQTSPILLYAIILSFFVGGVAGYGTRIWHEQTLVGTPTSPGGGGGSAPMGGGPPGGGGAPGGGGGAPMREMMMGGGGQGTNGVTLARTVHDLDILQKMQGQGLTPQQKSAVVPVLTAIKKSDKISDKDAQARRDSINAVLTDSQKKALAALAPAGRGGGMGGGMMGGMGGMMGGMGGMMGGGRPGMAGGMGGGKPGGGMPGGGPPGGMPGGGMPGGGMGGGRPGAGGPGGGAPDQPFASERNRQSLDDLLQQLQKKS